MNILSDLFAKVRIVGEHLDPRRIHGLVPLPDFCRARGLDFRALSADLLASVDPTRLTNNPVELPSDLFGQSATRSFAAP